MRDKYGIGQDPYCYPGTTILRNLLDIHNEDELEEAEYELTSLRLDAFVPDFDNLKLDYLHHIHFYLFQDIYPWAGKLRTVEISKGNTRFCTVSRLVIEAKRVFDQLKADAYLQGLDRKSFVNSLSDFFCELNVIHPYRDGNGRAIRLFCELIAIKAGYEISWKGISRQKWLDANIRGYYGDLRPLVELFDFCVVHQQP